MKRKEEQTDECVCLAWQSLCTESTVAMQHWDIMWQSLASAQT